MVHSGFNVPGTTAKTALTTLGTYKPAAWVNIQARSTNTGTIRVGDTSITSSNGGVVLVAGANVLLPWYGQAPSGGYDLQGVFIISSSGGTDGVDFNWAK